MRPRGVAARIRAFAALLALVLTAAAPGARATLPATGWMPASQGMIPMPGDGTDDLGYYPPYFYPIMRLRADPSVPGRFYAGHMFHGLYLYAAGVWTPLTPGCAVPGGNGERERLIEASGLRACTVIDIAIDPADPKVIYVSAVDLQGTINDPRFEPGGVFRSTDGGVTWTRISPAFRAAGLAVAHPPGGKAVIVAGHMQRTSADQGTTSSLLVSTNDGATWKSVRLVSPVGCPSKYVTVSPNLVASVAFHPTNPNIVYAGTNAGVYMSTNRGASWSLALKACQKYYGVYLGGAWGLAIARQGSTTTVYSATWDGVVRRSAPGSKSWTTIVTLPATHVRDLIVDVRAPGRLYAAAFGRAKPRAVEGVYKITGSSARIVGDNTLNEVASRLRGVPMIYYLTKSGATPSIAQHPLAPDLLYAATFGGVFVRSEAS